ncbi:MAG: hypothetical protein ACXWAC_12430 [Usitatibacter sp.]
MDATRIVRTLLVVPLTLWCLAASALELAGQDDGNDARGPHHHVTECISGNAGRIENYRDIADASDRIAGSFIVRAHVAFEDWRKPSGVRMLVQKVAVDSKEDGSPSTDRSSFEYFGFGLVYGMLYADVTDAAQNTWNEAFSVVVPFIDGDGYVGMQYDKPTGTFKFYTSTNGLRWSPLPVSIIDPNPPDRHVKMAKGGVARIEFGSTSYHWGFVYDPRGYDVMPVDVYSISVELQDGSLVAECEADEEGKKGR